MQTMGNTVINKLRNLTIARRKSPAGPFSFHGGVVLPGNKRALNNPLVDITLPEQMQLPLVNYHGHALSPLVSVGDSVKRGQMLANGIPSPTSGTVEHIGLRPIAHPSQLSATTLTITTDGLDQSLLQATDQSPEQHLQHFLKQPVSVITNAGMLGLGGAAFPTADKVNAWLKKGSSDDASNSDQHIHTLLINAAECEPEIACDEALMQTDAHTIVAGVDALRQLTDCAHCIIAIENTKTQAINSMRNALQAIHAPVELMLIPTIYPTGAESTLIKTVTGQTLGKHQKPTDKGILCINVATAHAMWQAIIGKSLDTRIVSLGGEAMPNPCNARVRFGTPLTHLLAHSGNAQVLANPQIAFRAGGPLSGFGLADLGVPVTAHSNCLLAVHKTNHVEPQACIRCGLCADSCPSQLLPQQLHRYAMAEQFELCEKYDLDSCIECGCCDLVCPSAIALTDAFRFAKSGAAEKRKQHQKAQSAEIRFEQREQRQHQRRQIKQQAIEARKRDLENQRAEAGKVSSTLERIRARQQAKKPK